MLRPGGLFWAGTWGHDPGQEGIWEDDSAEPKRFYAIRTDEAIRVYRFLLQRAPASPLAQHARDLLEDAERKAARSREPQG